MEIKDIFAKFESEIRRAPRDAASVDAILAFEFTGPNGGVHPEQGLYILKLNDKQGPPRVIPGEEALEFRPALGFDITYKLEVDDFKTLVGDPSKISDFFFGKKLGITFNDELEPKVQEVLRANGLA